MSSNLVKILFIGVLLVESNNTLENCLSFCCGFVRNRVNVGVGEYVRTVVFYPIKCSISLS